MNRKEREALERVIEYLSDEQKDYENCKEAGEDVSGHIWLDVQMVSQHSNRNSNRQDGEQPQEDDEWPVISRYTRAQAIEDGVLIDVSEMAKEAGFRYPVALTSAVYHEYVKVPEGVEGQDEAGRLWDILTMLRYGISRSKDDSEILFQLYVRNDNQRAELVTLKSICGPNDDMTPCITVMMPGED